MASESAFQLRNDDVVWREVDGEVIVLEMESGKYLNLNGSARLLWTALQSPSTVDDLVSLLVDSFAISVDEATKDSQAFLNSLSDRSLVERVA